MSGNFEINAFANQATGQESAEKISLQGFIGLSFDLSGDIPEEYKPVVKGQEISVEPYFRCTFGALSAEYNVSTRELKVGLGINAGLTPCELGVKEKSTIYQITNDPILETK